MQNTFFPTCQRKKFLLNESYILWPIFVWQNSWKLNKLSIGVPNIQVKTIICGVAVHQSKDLLFLNSAFPLENIG